MNSTQSTKTAQTDAHAPKAALPLSRWTCLDRTLRRFILAAILALPPVTVIPRLDFTPTATSNRITEISLLLLMLPLLLAGLISALAAARWLLAACWPKPLGLFASDQTLSFQLGPFGTQAFDTKRLRIQYLFDLDPDDIDPDLVYESLQPPEKQIQSQLPAITHPDTPNRLDRLILRFFAIPPERAAAILGPYLQAIREKKTTRNNPANAPTSTDHNDTPEHP